MKYRFYCYLGGLLLLVNGCFLRQSDQREVGILKAKEIAPVGRFEYTSNGLELISSATHFGFSFEGKECRVFAATSKNSAHGYLQYVLDGVYKERIKVSEDTDEPIILHAGKEGKHKIWIYKATEATTGPIAIRKIEAKHVASLANPASPIIEFIGNSITCGAASDPSDTPCGTGQYSDQHNAYQAYGPSVARALNAEFVLSSVSGIGIYRTWNTDSPSMPQVYERFDLQQSTSKKWKFKKYIPKIVSIALGTNDFSTGDGKNPRKDFDSTVYIAAYVKFVGLIKSKYPLATIALLSSPMVKGKQKLMFESCLKMIKTKADKAYPSAHPISLFFFESMEARGCAGHPSVEDHAILAQQLTPFFKKLMVNN
jgi:lysophospholipase L1-like esterase